MNDRFFKRTSVRLAGEVDLTAEAELALIGRLIPDCFPRPTPQTVRAFSAVVCNNLVDYYSTEFTDRALTQIAPLVADGANGMRNHDTGWDMDALPVCRYYAAEVRDIPGKVTRTGGQAREVVGRFYHERGTAFAEMMAARLMLAIWREVSLSWWMRSFTNSIDGQPFDESPYFPGQVFENGTVVIGIMDDVVEVDEISFVPRGGQKGTSIGATELTRGRDVLEVISAARARAGEKPAPWSMAHLLGRDLLPPDGWLKKLLGSGTGI